MLKIVDRVYYTLGPTCLYLQHCTPWCLPRGDPLPRIHTPRSIDNLPCLLFGHKAKKKDSCVQVSEVKKIRVGRSKNIFILEFFFITNVQRL